MKEKDAGSGGAQSPAVTPAACRTPAPAALPNSAEGRARLAKEHGGGGGARAPPWPPVTARPARVPPQDFICVSYLEPEQQARTLASRSDTPAEALCAQCAEKFEVQQPGGHRLFVLVDGRCFQLADDALPHRIKGYLLRCEPKRDFHFVYRPLDGGGGPPCLVVREPNFL